MRTSSQKARKEARTRRSMHSSLTRWALTERNCKAPPQPRPSSRPPRPSRRKLGGSWLCGGDMYRLLSSVTARAAATTGPVWAGGRRGAHRRPGLPVLGFGWAGGLGLGLGLALGAKLVVGLRGAAPVQSPADPAASSATELPHEQAPGPGSPTTPAPPATRGFSRAIESSRDLLHRIKVRAQWASGRRLPRKTFRFLTA